MPEQTDGVIRFNVDPSDSTRVTRSTEGPERPGYSEPGYLVAGEDGAVRFVAQTEVDNGGQP